MGQFSDEEFDTRIFIQRKIIRRDAGDAKQFSNNTFVHIAVLA